MAALFSLTLLAICSILASGMPRLLAWSLVAPIGVMGIRSARSHWKRPAIAVVFPGDGQPALVDGEVVQGMRVDWRGPLAFANWRDRGGSIRRLGWWPDTLPVAKRRELRLAASGIEAARQRA